VSPGHRAHAPAKRQRLSAVLPPSCAEPDAKPIHRRTATSSMTAAAQAQDSRSAIPTRSNRLTNAAFKAVLSTIEHQEVHDVDRIREIPRTASNRYARVAANEKGINITRRTYGTVLMNGVWW
jgi:hypothetical protein